MPHPRPPLLGTYAAPTVRLGERVKCLYRGYECVVTSWSKAPIPWPIVRPASWKGRQGLWVNDELARAVRTEAAGTIIYWFGATAAVVSRWRATLGANDHSRRWTAAEVALLGTAPDEEVAERIGRTNQAVLAKRCKHQISTYHDRRLERSGRRRRET